MNERIRIQATVEKNLANALKNKALALSIEVDEFISRDVLIGLILERGVNAITAEDIGTPMPICEDCGQAVYDVLPRKLFTRNDMDTTGMSSRLRNVLEKYDLETLKEVARYTREDIASWRGMGGGLLKELDFHMQAYGLEYAHVPPHRHTCRHTG